MPANNDSGVDQQQHQSAQQLCALLSCRYPVLQAGMGGVARAELVAAVALGGAYGSLGMVREAPELISAPIDAVREGTDQPFSVNIIPAATDPTLLDEQLAVCFAKQVHSVTLFWDVHAIIVKQIKAHGLLVLHQVGSVASAQAVEQAGADIIIAQGFEAGGHVHGDVTSLVLLPQLVQAVDVPVVAAGGFASGESLVAAWALGAAGIHCGTAFLATRESFAHDYHKQRIIDASAVDTVHTEIFALNWPPHSPVGVLRNSVTQAAENSEVDITAATEPAAIAFDHNRPLLRTSTDSPLRTTTGDLEALALFAGQVAGQLDSVPTAQQRIDTIMDSARRTLATLNQTSTFIAATSTGEANLAGHD